MQATLMEFPRAVQFYSAHAKALLQSQKHKVRKFLEHRCIEYAGEGKFICKPIEGYNKTTYELVKNEAGEFTCNCQHYTLKRQHGEEAWCSHLGALYEFFSRGRNYSPLPQNEQNKDNSLSLAGGHS